MTVAAARWMARGWVVVAAVVLAAGCSDGNVAAPTTSSVTTTTPATVATTAPPPNTSTSTTTTSTSMPATTAPTTTTVPESTAPNSSAAPSTTSLPDGVPPRVTFPDDPDKQAVVDAAYAFFDAARAAQASPSDQSLREALGETMTEPIANRMESFLDQLVLDGERIIASDSQPTYLQIYDPTVFAIDESGILDACAVDGDVRVSGPVGTEMVLDDDLVSGVQTYSLVADGDGWRVRDFTTVERFEGQAGCG